MDMNYGTETSSNMADISGILRYSGLAIWKVYCEENLCEMVSSPARTVRGRGRKHCYTKLLDKVLKRFVSAVYRSDIAKKCSLENLNTEFEKGKTQISVQVKRVGGDIEYNWFRIIASPEIIENGRVKTMYILVKDIRVDNVWKNSADAGTKRLDIAIRNTYSIIFDINFDYDTYFMTVYNDELMNTIPEKGVYSEVVKYLAKSSVYIDDRREFIEKLSIKNVTQRLGNGEQTLYHECRVSYDSKKSYRWVSIRIVKIPSANTKDNLGLIFVRDIDAQKREQLYLERESRRYDLVLRESYENIFDIDIKNDKLRIIQADVNNPEYVGEEYSYSQIYEYAHESKVAKDTLKDFEKLNPDNLREVFINQNQDQLYAEINYCGFGNNFHWVSVRLVKMENDDNSFSILALIRDIDAVMREKFEGQTRELQYNAALKESFDAIYRLDLNNRIYEPINLTLASSKIIPNFKDYDKIVQYTAEHLVHPDDRENYIKDLQFDKLCECLDKNGEKYIEYRKINDNGEYYWSAMTFKSVEDKNSNSRYAICFIRSIDEKKKSENLEMKYKMLKQQMQYQKELQISNSRYKVIVQQTGSAVFEWISDYNGVYASENLPKHFRDGFIRSKSIKGALDYNYIYKDDYTACDEFLAGLERNLTQLELTCRMLSDNDEYTWYKIAVANIFDENGKLERIVGTMRDVDAEKKAYETLRYRAEYDSLTGAPNMQKFTADAEKLLSTDIFGKYAIIRFDVDKFKIINDIYGTGEGDRVLQYISDTLESFCGENTIFARMNSDVFVMLMRYDDTDTIIELINKVNKSVSRYPIEHKMKLSAGICIVDDRGVPVNLLCDRANLAAKKIKGNLLFNYVFYDENLRNEILQEKAIEDEMNDALSGRQFKLFLQPKYNIETSTVIGAEALVRWIHPEKGLIPPSAFIDLFERNGFIIKLDEYMWEETCKTLRKWIDRGYKPIPVSINVSRVHANNPRLYDSLINLVRKYDLSPRLIELELTESAFLDDLGGLLKTLDKLQKAGFLLAMDDFGAGYSSLNMLKNVPIDIIKIDREFLNETVVTERGKTVIRYTIAMAKQLDMKVVAEGVETIDQAAFLLDAGCNIAQGFYYSKPVDVGTFEMLAFNRKKEKAIEPEITDVLSKNRDIVSIMTTIDYNSKKKDDLPNLTISNYELNTLRTAFNNVINKYRLVIQKLDTTLFEVDFKSNRVFTTLNQRSVLGNVNFTNFESIYNFTTEHCGEKYAENLKRILNTDYLRSECKDTKSELTYEFEMEIEGNNIWVQLDVIPILRFRQIEKIILVYRNITDLKISDHIIEENKEIMDISEDRLFVWNVYNDNLKISNNELYDDDDEGELTLDGFMNSSSQDGAEQNVYKTVLEKIAEIKDGRRKIDDIEYISVNANDTEYIAKTKTITDSYGSPYKIIGIIKERDKTA